ncbi:MAG TPA: PIN domain-containing protein, partial [Geminicoccaceae bacterium]
MIGIDTNVLLRATLDDDPAQSPAAKGLIEAAKAAGDAIRIDRLVLAEALWTLARRYRYTREQLVEVVEALSAAPELRLEGDRAINDALAVFRDGRLDFADALIGVLNRRAGCS